MLGMWMRRQWGRQYVKITRRVGEEEILEISFNERQGQRTVDQTRVWLDFLYERVQDHNKRVLDATATVGGSTPQDHVKRVK